MLLKGSKANLVFLVLVGVSTTTITYTQSTVIPHHTQHDYGSGISSRYFDKVVQSGYGYSLGYSPVAYFDRYSYNDYPGYGRLSKGYDGLGLVYGRLAKGYDGLGIAYRRLAQVYDGLGLGYGRLGHGYEMLGHGYERLG